MKETKADLEKKLAELKSQFSEAMEIIEKQRAALSALNITEQSEICGSIYREVIKFQKKNK